MTESADQINFDVNGVPVSLDIDESTPLIFALRNDLGLKGVRSGCLIGECGACTVIMNGRAIRSCNTPIAEAADASVITPEGLGDASGSHPVRQAFLDEQAAQCGYCINGMIMTVSAMLDGGEASDAEALRAGLAEHICRCGTHGRILRACERAAGRPPDGTHLVIQRPDGASGALDGAGFQIPKAVVKSPKIESWITLGSDGQVVINPGKVELGQGITTTFIQMVAAQIGLSIEQIRSVPTRTGSSPDQGTSSGSWSTEHGGVALAMAAVAFRRVLLNHVAERLGCAAASLRLEPDGSIHAATEEVLSLSELSPAAGTGLIEESDVPRWDVAPVGLALPRTDLLPKLSGAPAYLHDLEMEGMLHARAVFSDAPIDVAPARQVAGVRHVEQDGLMTIVIAEREEQAVRAYTRLSSSGDDALQAGIDTVELFRGLPVADLDVVHDDDVAVLLETGTTHRATYSRPYQSHGPMSPSAAVAIEEDGILKIWSHTQGVYPLRRELAALLGRSEDRIVIEHADGPGCYGMNGADDAGALAAIAAIAVPGQPVRFQFTISDEFGFTPQGTGGLADLAAALDVNGKIVGWRHHATSDTHSTRPRGDGHRLLPAWYRSAASERPLAGLGEPGVRNATPLYVVPALDIAGHLVRGPVRTSALRSLGAFLNVFAAESFMDELAELAGKDPLEFRLDHLDDPRARHVLEVAAEQAGWVPHVGPSGVGRGIAVSRYKGVQAYTAVVADVDVDGETGNFSVTRLVVVSDAGAIMNPDGLSNQIEGGALQGLSRTIAEELRANNDGGIDRDWTTYPVLRFADVPRVDVTLIDRPDCRPLGAGETSPPPVPAAIANALDDRLGVRMRHLPITPARLERRLYELDETEMQRVLL